MVLQHLSRKRRKRRLVGIGLPATPGDNTAITRIVQPKLRVSQPDDAQEREADSVADRVMRGTRAETAAPVTGETIQRQCPECEEEPYSYGPEGFRFEPGGDTCEAQEVNDSDVGSHVKSNLERANDDPSTAFSYLRNERERNCCDVDLAAAEHYMYARSQVQSGDSSYSGMVLQIRAYDAVKSVVPDSLLPRTGNCPPTPGSDAQVRWALKGASAGKKHRED